MDCHFSILLLRRLLCGKLQYIWRTDQHHGDDDNEKMTMEMTMTITMTRMMLFQVSPSTVNVMMGSAPVPVDKVIVHNRYSQSGGSDFMEGWQKFTYLMNTFIHSFPSAGEENNIALWRLAQGSKESPVCLPAQVWSVSLGVVVPLLVGMVGGGWWVVGPKRVQGVPCPPAQVWSVSLGVLVGIVELMVADMAVVDYKRPQCASLLRFNLCLWQCSIGVMALVIVRVVAIPLGKMPRVQRVLSLPPFTCSPSSGLKLREVLSPVKGVLLSLLVAVVRICLRSTRVQVVTSCHRP